MSNITFFEDICEQQILKDALLKHGFLKPNPYTPEGGVRNDGLKFEKRNWFLPATGDRVERVCVHYESARRGHFCIHVEIDPYDKGKSIKPGDRRLITLAFELKTHLTQTDISLRLKPALSTSERDWKRVKPTLINSSVA